jgi:N-methylhydantoinase B/oxoprolinase/acetone carboxylase alpha subunit
MGGRPGADGLGAISFPYNVRNVSVEWSETETPVLFLRRELITDSGGAGRWRGGLGEDLVMTVEKTAPVPPSSPLTLSGSAGRTRYAARGVAGGSAGSLGWIGVNGAPIAPTSAPELQFMPGDVVALRTPGGAGHGKAQERALDAIEADIKNGYISAGAAERDFDHHS